MEFPAQGQGTQEHRAHRLLGPAWCAATYVLEDNGDSFVLVSGGSTAGWFDAVAAAKETNLPFMALMGIPGN